MLPPRSLTASRAPFLAEYRTSHLTVLKLASLALPVSPSPSGDTPTVHCMGDPEKEQNPNLFLGHGFPVAIAMTAPAP
jgi:hypothetical protein